LYQAKTLLFPEKVTKRATIAGATSSRRWRILVLYRRETVDRIPVESVFESTFPECSIAPETPFCLGLSAVKVHINASRPRLGGRFSNKLNGIVDVALTPDDFLLTPVQSLQRA